MLPNRVGVAVRHSFRERLALYLMGGMFLFSGAFVALTAFTPEFGATAGTMAGIIIGGFVTSLVAVVGRDVVDRALRSREDEEK